MKPRVFITKKIPVKVEEYLAPFCEYKKWDSESMISRDILLHEVQDVQGLLTHGCKMDEEVFINSPGLKIVSNMSVGYNNFDLNAMKEYGVLGTNTPGILDETVADLIMALILASGRRIVELDRLVKDGKWDKLIGEDLYGVDVHHTTLGIIGMGRIGEAVARRARFGFNMDILYHNRKPKPELEEKLSAQYCTFEKVLSESDYLVLMTPLTEQTLNLMGEEQFSLMKHSAIFVNASRGEAVNEEALLKALMQHRIRGAALDVYEKEPIDIESPLLKLPNVITVPHIGSAVQKTRDAMAMLAAENLVKGLYGETPPNLIQELK